MFSVASHLGHQIFGDARYFHWPFISITRYVARPDILIGLSFRSPDMWRGQIFSLASHLGHQTCGEARYSHWPLTSITRYITRPDILIGLSHRSPDMWRGQIISVASHFSMWRGQIFSVASHLGHQICGEGEKFSVASNLGHQICGEARYSHWPLTSVTRYVARPDILRGLSPRSPDMWRGKIFSSTRGIKLMSLEISTNGFRI